MSYAIVLLTSYESLKQSKRINTLSVVMASLQLNLSTSGIAARKVIFIVIKFQPNLLKEVPIDQFLTVLEDNLRQGTI